jgi:hypothetical protein
MTATKTAVANCSFCARPNTDVSTLIGGPGVYICDECVSLCNDILAAKPAVASKPLPRNGDMTLEELLSLLPNVAATGTQVEENLVEWVRKARALGATWARIGETLGMTRQSAWERFSGER